jgi:hypothetical protein
MERTLTAQALVATAGVTLGPGSVARFDPEDSPLQGGCVADFRGDGSTNTIDVLGFLNAWSTGC